MTARYEVPGGGVAPRLRFQEFGFQRTPDGHCHARVVLAWGDGREFAGDADGMTSQAGELRCAATAAVHALEQATARATTFELLGVKAVRAFDATVVIVSLAVRDPGRGLRLVGSFLTDTDPPRGAALAVLNATNRVMGNYFATR
jgi:hypothetical protein